MVTRIEIPSNMLEWAIVRAGYSIDQYLKDNADVAAWVLGIKKPTIRQAEELANRLHVPFGLLFLSEPQQESSPIPFFRGEANSGALDINTYETVLSLQRRQAWLSDYLRDNDFEPRSFVGILDPSKTISEILVLVRQILQLHETWAFSMQNNDKAVSHITEIFEDLGIVVVFNGVVGYNTHRPIKVEECRGFSLVDKMAPFIFVNSADSKTAQLFTLIHEFVHLLFGFSSGYGGEGASFGHDIEKVCDNVAAEFLVPTDTLLQNWRGIDRTAKKFKVSPLVIARRALQLKLISKQEFFEFYEDYLMTPIIAKNNGSGDFVRVARKRIGYTFAVHVNNAIKTNQITRIEAYRLTGLYGKTFSNFMSRL